MKKQETKQTKEDALAEIKELKKELLEMRFLIVSNQLKDVSKIKKTRKEIARLSTYIRSIGKGE